MKTFEEIQKTLFDERLKRLNKFIELKAPEQIVKLALSSFIKSCIVLYGSYILESVISNTIVAYEKTRIGFCVGCRDNTNFVEANTNPYPLCKTCIGTFDEEVEKLKELSDTPND